MKFDGMIVTGAPVEQMEFEEVDYWNELTEIMDWTESHVTSTIFLCWAAQASLYHFYGLQKRQLDHKMFGLFWHKVLNRKIRWSEDLMMLFLHHIPDIQRFQSKISVHVKISRFLQNLRRRGFFLQWRRGDVRFLSWDIRNMTV